MKLQGLVPKRFRQHLVQKFSDPALQGTDRFVKDCLSEQREFKTEVAKVKLLELWNVEKALLQDIDNFAKLIHERGFSDMRTVGVISASYDRLAHLTLCLLHPLPEWTEYVLNTHRHEIEIVAALGSPKAKTLLGISPNTTLDRPSDGFIANRFFLDDEVTYLALRRKYEGK